MKTDHFQEEANKNFLTAFSRAFSWIRDTGIMDRSLLRGIPLHALPDGGANARIKELGNVYNNDDEGGSQLLRKLNNDMLLSLYLFWAVGCGLGSVMFAVEMYRKSRQNSNSKVNALGKLFQ